MRQSAMRRECVARLLALAAAPSAPTSSATWSANSANNPPGMPDVDGPWRAELRRDASLALQSLAVKESARELLVPSPALHRLLELVASPEIALRRAGVGAIRALSEADDLRREMLRNEPSLLGALFSTAQTEVR